jgi:hypothetical protein
MSKSQPRYPAEIPKLKNRSHAKILVLTRLRDESPHDKAVLAGASGGVGSILVIVLILFLLGKI